MRFHALCALYVIVVLGGCSQTLSQISNEHGFQRIQGPSKTLGPGTLIVLEESGDSLAVLTPVCWQPQAFPGLPPARAVPGAESALKGKFGDWHDFEPPYLKALREEFPKVEEIQLRFRNTSVFQYSETDLYKGIPARLQSCRDAVAAREAKGETVYTILKALKADVTYKVIGVDRSRLVGKLPQKTLERLKTKLGGSSINTFTQTIAGATHQVAFQADIIGLENFSLPLADPEGDPIMDTQPKPLTDKESVSPGEPQAMSSDEANSVSTMKNAEISNMESGEFSRRSRLTQAQRQLIIQKMAILRNEISDADRLQQ